MTKLTIPPMPTLECDAPLWPYITRLEAWSRDLAAIAQREAALADELAEALESACDTLESFDGLIGYGPDCDEKIAKWGAVLAKHTAARQMNREAER